MHHLKKMPTKCFIMKIINCRWILKKKILLLLLLLNHLKLEHKKLNKEITDLKKIIKKYERKRNLRYVWTTKKYFTKGLAYTMNSNTKYFKTVL